MNRRTQSEAHRKTLIFVHIPKTAGSTLEQILIRQYRAAEIYPFIEVEDYRRVTKLPPAEKTRYKLFQGHMPYGLHHYLAQPAVYVTLLRNPVQVALSSYFYFELGYRRDILHQDVTGIVPTVADMQQSKMRMMFDNLQTRHLSGLTGVAFGECSAAMLDAAKANLEREFAVGLVERFDESVVSLSKIFRWRAPFYVKTNVSRTRVPREAIAADVIEWLTAQNRFDIQLYQFAESLFDAQLENLDVSIDQAVMTYRSGNRLLGSLFDTMSRAKRKASQVKFIGEFV
jgi:hypothetical protein